MLHEQFSESKRLNLILLGLLTIAVVLLITISVVSLTLTQELEDLKTVYVTETNALKRVVTTLETTIEEKNKEIKELSIIADELYRIDTIAATTGLPKDVVLSLYNGARDSGIELAIVLALIQTESSFQIDLVHHNTNGTIDTGIMQINSCHADTWQAMYGEPYTVANVTNADKNIEMGLKLLSEHLENNDWDMTAALTAYNRGQGGMEKLYRNTGSATSSYSRLVYERAEYWRNIIS